MLCSLVFTIQCCTQSLKPKTNTSLPICDVALLARKTIKNYFSLFVDSSNFEVVILEGFSKTQKTNLFFESLLSQNNPCYTQYTSLRKNRISIQTLLLRSSFCQENSSNFIINLATLFAVFVLRNATKDKCFSSFH